VKKKSAFILRIGVSLALISIFLFFMAREHGSLSGAFQHLFKAFSTASLPWLLPAFSLHIIGLCLISFRWKVLLKAQAIEKSFKELFLFYFMAAFFNNFLPSTIGGDAIRAIESNRQIKNAPTSVMVVLIERITGLLALLIISILATLAKVIQGNPDSDVIFILVITSALFLLLIIFSHPRIAPIILLLLGKLFPAKIYHFFNRAYAALEIYYKKTSVLFIAIGISIVFQLNMVFYYFFIARAFVPDIQLLDCMVKVPIMIFLLMVAPVINGIGIRSWTFQELMRFPPALALAVELIDLGMRMIYGLFGGAIYLCYKRPKSK